MHGIIMATHPAVIKQNANVGISTKGIPSDTMPLFCIIVLIF